VRILPLLLTGAQLLAQEPQVSVRMFWRNPPQEVRIETVRDAKARACASCKASAWSGARRTSAWACSSLWLAFHDDMANPTSKDPVARESTRLYCAAVNGHTREPVDVRDRAGHNRVDSDVGRRLLHYVGVRRRISDAHP